MNNIYENSILLIGGMSIGKSTVAKLLSKELNMDVISLDAVKDDFLDNVLFENQLKIRKEQGYDGEIKYLIPFLNMAINHTIDNLSNPCILDMSAFFENQLNYHLINKMTLFGNIIYLYSENNKKILERRKIDINSELGKIYLTTLSNPINDELCSIKINVDSKEPSEIVEEIINSIKTITKKQS